MYSSMEMLWNQAVTFHGHSCPGLAIGCRMVYEAAKVLGLSRRAEDEELVCITETDACGVDAVQALMGCTLGKGNLLLKLRGKAAMSFYVRQHGSGVRIVWQGVGSDNIGREEKIQRILHDAADGLFTMQMVEPCAVPKALLSPSILCTQCGERTSEAMLRYMQGAPYCLDCYPNHSRLL